MKNKAIGLMTFAILIQAIITYCNKIYVEGKLCWKMIFSLILGIVATVVYKIDLQSYFSLKSDIPYIG